MDDPIPSAPKVNGFDAAMRSLMTEYRTPGVSIAVIGEGRVSDARGYGFTNGGPEFVVTPDTLFQAASISKPVVAVAALRLVEQGKLALDEDVDLRLRTWKVPENEFTVREKVTVRRILSHDAGLTVHGFPGYIAGKPVPTLVQILDGQPPANTAAVRVDVAPGGAYRYSGGGYEVLHQLMLDVTGQTFPELMRELVLKPFGMDASTFEQPLPVQLASKAATGHLKNGKAVPGKWLTYPEMAAAGLWTTPSDLARFAIGIQNSFTGNLGDRLESHAPSPQPSPPMGAREKNLSRAMAVEMLTRQASGQGLGLQLMGSGEKLRFTHSGRTIGFDSLMLAFAETGKGAVIMFNANVDEKLPLLVLKEIAKEFKWREEG